MRPWRNLRATRFRVFRYSLGQIFAENLFSRICSKICTFFPTEKQMDQSGTSRNIEQEVQL